MSVEAERLDRLEHHMTLFKKNGELQNDTLHEQSRSLQRIEEAIAGSLLNGGEGMAHDIKNIKGRVKNLEDKELVLSDNIRTVKWVFGGAGALLVWIIWVFTGEKF